MTACVGVIRSLVAGHSGQIPGPCWPQLPNPKLLATSSLIYRKRSSGCATGRSSMQPAECWAVVAGDDGDLTGALQVLEFRLSPASHAEHLKYGV